MGCVSVRVGLGLVALVGSVRPEASPEKVNKSEGHWGHWLVALLGGSLRPEARPMEVEN